MQKNIIKIVDEGENGYLLVVEDKEIRFLSFSDAELFIKKLSKETQKEYLWEYDSNYIANKAIAIAPFNILQKFPPLMVADKNLQGLDDEEDEATELLKTWILETAYKSGADFMHMGQPDEQKIGRVFHILLEEAEKANITAAEIRELILTGAVDEAAKIENIDLNEF